jgi:hypothetical protein
MIVIDVIALASLAEVAILMAPLPLTTMPFAGELIATLGGPRTKVVTETGGDSAEEPAGL